MRSLPVYIAFAVTVLSGGCDTLGPSLLEQDVVIEAYLIAGEPMSEVRLTRTIAIDEHFDADSLGITDADVRIELLADGGDPGKTYPYAPMAGRPGIYIPDQSDPEFEEGESMPTVLPLRTYRLVVNTPEAPAPITSVTTVPDTFDVASVDSDTVVYRSDEPLIVYLSRSSYPARQPIFIFTTVALEPRVSNLTPFARAVYDGGDATIESLTENVSLLLNEENFDLTGDGLLRVQYPWLAVTFVGRNRLVFQALDDNQYDFIRSQSVQQGGSTLPPGEIPNVLEHVSGGRGLFGSVARASVEFVVLRDESGHN